MRSFILLLLLVGIPDGHVTDKAGMLTPTEKTELEETLRAYEQRTTNELAVLIVSTLEDSSIEEYANAVFHQWGIGKKGKDNGVLFVWATKERKVRIEVGYGLEGLLPDGRAGQIIRENITPSFKAGRWKEGVFGGMDAIMTQLDREPLAPPPPTSPSTSYIPIAALVGFGILCACWVYFVFGRKEEEPLKIAPTPPWKPTKRTIIPGPPVIIRTTPRKFVKEEPSPAPVHRYESPAPSYSPPAYDPPSSSSSSSDFGGFGGGDSGGGGASGDY